MDSCTKPYAAANSELKLWWGLKLTLLLIVCGTAKPTVSSSHPYFLNVKNPYILLSKHQFKQVKYPFFVTIDTITYKGAAILCPGSTLLLSAENAPSNASYKWFKDGNLVPIATTTTYTVTTPGTYSLTIGYNGITNNYSPLVITQDSAPVAQFKYTTTSYCPSSIVNFTNLSTGDGLTYNWDFGDLNSVKYLRTSNLANPSHTFIGTTGNGTQTFTVTLVATTKGGCTNTVTKTITLSQSPDTKFGGINPTVFNGRDYFASCTNAPSAFTFTNLSTTDNSSYNIYWGDASGSTTLNNFTTITHTYPVGNFTMRYTVNGKTVVVAQKNIMFLLVRARWLMLVTRQFSRAQILRWLYILTTLTITLMEPFIPLILVMVCLIIIAQRQTLLCTLFFQTRIIKRAKGKKSNLTILTLQR